MRIVLTSVYYADFLAVTIEAWKAIIPAGCLTVATSPEDRASEGIARDHGVPVLLTTGWSRIDPLCHKGAPPGFNMALGLDEALGWTGNRLLRPEPGELCGHVNPDCYPEGTWPAEDRFEAGTVYGFWRYACDTPAEFDAYREGTRALDIYPRMKNAKAGPIGYCQLVRYQPGMRFGSYPSAGGFDTDFNKRIGRVEMLEDVKLLHLGGRDRRNWSGRTIPQWGVATC